MQPRIEPKYGFVYRISSRNLRVAVWNGHTFVGIREKFGERFLDSSEISWTVLQELCSVPDELLPIEEIVAWGITASGAHTYYENGKRYYEDGTIVPDNVMVYCQENKDLFRFLDEIESKST